MRFVWKLFFVMMMVGIYLPFMAKAGNIKSVSVKGDASVVDFNGDVDYKLFYLDNPPRCVVDILKVSQCPVCLKNAGVRVYKEGDLKVRIAYHNDKKEKEVKKQGKFLRICVEFPKNTKPACRVKKDDKSLILNYRAKVAKNEARQIKQNKAVKLNKIERISYRRFKTYEMVVLLTENKPLFYLKEGDHLLYVDVKNAKASPAALKSQDLKSLSDNVNSIITLQKGDMVRCLISLKKGAQLKKFYADKRHIYIIFPLKGTEKLASAVPDKPKTGSKSSSSLVDEGSNKIFPEDKLISFDVRDAQLKDIFRVFAQISGLNIIVGDDVKGTLTMKLKDVPLNQAMDLILQQEGLVADRKGNVVVITTASRYQKQKQEEIKAIKDKERLERIKSAITKVINLNYITPDYAINIINKLLYNTGNAKNANNGGFIVSDVKNNALICHDTKENIAKIEKIVKIIDQKKRAVEIDARIVEISKSYERQLGIQWGGNYFNQDINHSKTFIGIGGTSSPVDVSNGLPPTESFSNDNFVVNLPASLSDAPTSTVSLAVGNVIANYNLDLKLTMGELEGYSKVLSTPKVITLDNEHAIISSGQQIPYQESAGSSGATSTSFKDATLSLDVTPHITRNNQVILKLTITKNSPDYAHSVGGEPPINTNSVESTVILKDGQTVVIGGLMQSTTEKTVGGVPGLMRIPLLGWLFKTKRIYNPQRELYIFVTPHIIKE